MLSQTELTNWLITENGFTDHSCRHHHLNDNRYLLLQCLCTAQYTANTEGAQDPLFIIWGLRLPPLWDFWNKLPLFYKKKNRAVSVPLEAGLRASPGANKKKKTHRTQFLWFCQSRLIGRSHCCEPSSRQRLNQTWREEKAGWRWRSGGGRGGWMSWWMDVCDVCSGSAPVEPLWQPELAVSLQRYRVSMRITSPKLFLLHWKVVKNVALKKRGIHRVKTQLYRESSLLHSRSVQFLLLKDSPHKARGWADTFWNTAAIKLPDSFRTSTEQSRWQHEEV